MLECTKCNRNLPDSRFGSKSWKNKDGSTTFSKKSHCRDCVNESNLSRYHNRSATKDAHKSAAYKYMIKSYGLTVEQYEEMLKSQEGRCKSCGDLPKRRLNIDHCHSTGKVRGLLCSPCNQALGHLKDDPVRINKLIGYLDGSK